ncbi:MAG: hypothetical protein ACLPSF_04930 [Methylocella sp.]
MSSEFLGGAGDRPAFERIQTAALYDLETGKILHLHSVMTFAGGARTADEDVVAAALREASRRHADPGRFGVALSNKPEHAHRPHRIDPVSKKFVPLPRRSRIKGDAKP